MVAAEDTGAEVMITTTEVAEEVVEEVDTGETPTTTIAVTVEETDGMMAETMDGK